MKMMQIVNTVVSTISAIVMVFLTLLIWKTNNRVAAINEHALNMEKYRQTIKLCNEFNDWYRYKKISHQSTDLPADSIMLAFRIWEKNVVMKSDPAIAPIEKKMKEADSSQRMAFMTENLALQRILGYFEDAMMLHKKGLLDRDYFDDFFSSMVNRLEKTSEPSIHDYIRSMCTKTGRNDIWSGYAYCRDKILTENLTIPASVPMGVIKDMKYRKGDRVKVTGKKGPVAILLQTQSKIDTLRPVRSGTVSGVHVKKGDIVSSHTIVMEIVPE